MAGFGDLPEKVVSATGNLRILLVVETLPAMLQVIEVIKEYHWSWTKHLAVVREIALKGESVRLLRERVRKHLSSSVQCEEVYATVYLDSARLFPLKFRGEPKKQTGLSDEAFLRWVLGRWEDVDLGQISWVEQSPLVSGVQEIYDPTTTNAKKDAAQNEIQYVEKAGRTVQFLAYLFRYADNRTDKDEVEKIATAFRTMSNEFSTMPRTTPLLSAEPAPVAGF